MIVLLLFAGMLLALLFAGAETALLALSEEFDHDRRGLLSERLEPLLRDPDSLLLTLVVGNLSSLALGGAALTVALLEYLGLPGIALSAVIFAPLCALATEVIPRASIRRRPEAFLAAIAGPLLIFHRIAAPVVFGGSLVSAALVGLLDGILPSERTARHDSGTNHEIARARDARELQEEQLVESIVEFGDTLVKEVMVPRRDMIALPAGATLDAAIDLAVETEYSRLPIYQEGQENVVGVVHTKDLLPFARGLELEPFSLVRVSREPPHVPGVMAIDDLLTEFQASGQHMAFVVDEFGGTCGLITLEDVLEEIFGDIQDEHDDDEVQPIRRIGRSVWLVDGTTDLDSVERVLQVEFPD